MATKTDFSAQEWATLRDAAHLTALAVTASGSSGIFGTIKEGVSISAARNRTKRKQPLLLWR